MDESLKQVVTEALKTLGALALLVPIILTLYRDLKATQKKLEEMTLAWKDEIKSRSVDAELFKRALLKRQDNSSSPPPSS